jgi:hypothetical protein
MKGTTKRREMQKYAKKSPKPKTTCLIAKYDVEAQLHPHVWGISGANRYETELSNEHFVVRVEDL